MTFLVKFFSVRLLTGWDKLGLVGAIFGLLFGCAIAVEPRVQSVGVWLVHGVCVYFLLCMIFSMRVTNQYYKRLRFQDELFDAALADLEAARTADDDAEMVRCMERMRDSLDKRMKIHLEWMEHI